jgi:hypothetical protein
LAASQETDSAQVNKRTTGQKVAPRQEQIPAKSISRGPLVQKQNPVTLAHTGTKTFPHALSPLPFSSRHPILLIKKLFFLLYLSIRDHHSLTQKLQTSVDLKNTKNTEGNRKLY